MYATCFYVFAPGVEDSENFKQYLNEEIDKADEQRLKFEE